MISELQPTLLGAAGPLARELTPEIEKTILGLVVDGFDRWRDGGYKRFGDYENHFTIRLVECMKDIRRERNMVFMPRYQNVEPSDEMFEGDADPARAPQIDMVVLWDLLSDEAHLSIECKRLAPGDLARLYVANGMTKFVSGYYGAKAEIGAMVGYVISGSAFAAVGCVNDLVERSDIMDSSHALNPTDPIGWLNSVFVSNHARSSPFPAIRLSHLFFDMTKI